MVKLRGQLCVLRRATCTRILSLMRVSIRAVDRRPMEDRLIAGVNTLAELPPKLRQRALLIPEKAASGATHDDAETSAKYKGLRPDPSREENPHSRFIKEAME
jgi:hypothetical protein